MSGYPLDSFEITKSNERISLITQQVYREIREQGYTGSDQPIVRFFAQLRKKKDARKFKQVDPSKETPVQAPPKRPPTASQVAHWITFKEDQRLEWQQSYLTQLSFILIPGAFVS